MSQEKAKKAAAEKATQIVQTGMVIGLGTGSTANYFIDALAILVKQGLQLQAVSSSNQSLQRAERAGIAVHDINDVSHIDLTIDGADEVDPQKNLIKGAGGAHVREKIVATASKSMVVIIDPTKVVSRLGEKKPLPVELLFFGLPSTLRQIQNLGLEASLRRQKDGSLFVTDNSGVIADITIKNDDEAAVHTQLLQIPGVVESGFFPQLATKVIVGYNDGTAKIVGSLKELNT